jgi:hypothetical protein
MREIEQLDIKQLEAVTGGLSYGASCFAGGAFGAVFGSIAGGPGVIAGAGIGCLTGLAKRAIDGPSQ